MNFPIKKHAQVRGISKLSHIFLFAFTMMLISSAYAFTPYSPFGLIDPPPDSLIPPIVDCSAAQASFAGSPWSVSGTPSVSSTLSGSVCDTTWTDPNTGIVFHQYPRATYKCPDYKGQRQPYYDANGYCLASGTCPPNLPPPAIQYDYSIQKIGAAIVKCVPKPSISCPYGGAVNAVGLCDAAQGCLAPNAINPQTGQCEPPETYTITLDQKSATLEPTGTAAQNIKTSQTFTATVTGSLNGAKAGAKVTIKADVKQSTGGHVHTDTQHRPKGYLGNSQTVNLCDPNAIQPQACITGTTDDKGQFTFTFTSTEVSGEHTVTASCDVCKGSEDKADVKVMVEGLVSLTANPTDYVLVGATSEHGDNHYLTPAAKAVAERLAKTYHKQFPNDPPLHFNDASLIEGGVFDICTGNETSGGCATSSYKNIAPMCQLQPDGTYSCSWARPHAEHRRGSVIDVRANNVVPGVANYATSIPSRNEKKFLDFAIRLGIDTGIRPHSPKSSNRHWHIRLLGASE